MSDRVCGRCGSMWTNAFSYCPHDGAPLGPASAAPARPPAPARPLAFARDYAPGASRTPPRVADEVRDQVRALEPRARIPLTREPFEPSEGVSALGPAFADRIFSKDKLHHPAALCETAAYPRPAVSMTSGESEPRPDHRLPGASPAETRRGFQTLRRARQP